MCRTTGITSRPRSLISLTINLKLKLLRCKTVLTTPALNTLAAFANASAQSAAEVRAVARAPRPDTTVCRVITAQRHSALRAQPDGFLAIAGVSRKRNCRDASLVPWVGGVRI